MVEVVVGVEVGVVVVVVVVVVVEVGVGVVVVVVVVVVVEVGVGVGVEVGVGVGVGVGVVVGVGVGVGSEPGLGIRLMHLEVGQNYFVRTVTDYWIGRLVSVDAPYTVTLVDLAWVANTGRLHIFVRDGAAPGMEIEPYPDGHEQAIHWLTISPWPHALFREAIPS